MGDLAGTVVVVTGAAGGIGGAVASAFEDAAAHVVGIDREQADGDERIRARLGDLQPLTGDFGAPEDVAAAALYLATAGFVTGAVLTVDGGWTAR